MTKKIELSDSVAKKLYKTASPELRIILEENFDKKILSTEIKDRIQIFEDIIEIVSELRGCKIENYLPWPSPRNKNERSQNSVAKIQLITEAYNEGTKLNWEDRSQRKYGIWFERKARGGGWVLHVVSDDRYYCSLGAGFYFKEEALARDAYSKFPEIFHEYLPE